MNEKKRLSDLTFSNGELNFYSCSIKFLEGDIDTHYDWSEDVMSKDWDPKKAKLKLDTILLEALAGRNPRQQF